MRWPTTAPATSPSCTPTRATSSRAHKNVPPSSPPAGCRLHFGNVMNYGKVNNERFWEKPVQRYVEECIAGQAGPRGINFNMRWVASMVAEVHRILTRGGVFLY